jgi:hypothetical protein
MTNSSAPSFSESDRYIGKSNVASFAVKTGLRVRLQTGVWNRVPRTDTLTKLNRNEAGTERCQSGDGGNRVGVKRSARITEAIAVLGHQVLAREDPDAKDDDGCFAWVGQERVSATAAACRDANGKARGRAKGTTNLEAFL